MEQNPPVWYISAMLLVMPILYFFYFKFKDFFLYIFSPIAALYLWGHFCQLDHFPGRNEFNGWCLGAIPRAICGLCFGVCAYMIYEKIIAMPKTKLRRILFTILETTLYLVFFIAWLVLQAPMKTIFSLLLLFPFMIAITFSQMSYISELFKFKWMRFLAPLSLTIYFNHWAGMRIVNNFHQPISYKSGVLLMALYTVGICILHWIIHKVFISIYKKVKNKI